MFKSYKTYSLVFFTLLIACKISSLQKSAVAHTKCTMSSLINNPRFIIPWKKDSVGCGDRNKLTIQIDSIIPTLNGDSMNCVIRILGTPNETIKISDLEMEYCYYISGFCNHLSAENQFLWNFHVFKGIIQHSERPIP